LAQDVKVKAKQVWKNNEGEVKVSRLNKDFIFFYPKQGGGAEQKMAREKFVSQFTLVK
jgi:hypothetical protein